MSEVFGEMIYSYSRADALRDGVLIQADPQLCKEVGIRWPVAITDHLWGYVDPGYLEDLPGQSVTGRMWDLLWMFRTSISRRDGGERIFFKVIFLMKRDPHVQPRQETISVLAVCGPGDDDEPVITLMLPEDD